jgi:hypothetical protein
MAVRPLPLDTNEQMTTDIPKSIITPDSVETRLDTLKFKDGVPDVATAQKVFDEIDYVHADAILQQ